MENVYTFILLPLKVAIKLNQFHHTFFLKIEFGRTRFIKIENRNFFRFLKFNQRSCS